MKTPLVDRGWKAMEARLDEVMPTNHRRRGAILWYLLSTAIVALGIGLWLGQRWAIDQHTSTDLRAKTSQVSTDTKVSTASNTTPGIASSSIPPRQNTSEPTSNGTQPRTSSQSTQPTPAQTSSTDISSKNNPSSTRTNHAIDEPRGAALTSPTSPAAHGASTPNYSGSSSKSKIQGISTQITSAERDFELQAGEPMDSYMTRDASLLPQVGITAPPGKTVDNFVLISSIEYLELKALDHNATTLELPPFTPLAEPTADEHQTSKGLTLSGNVGGGLDDTYRGLQIGLGVEIPLAERWTLASGISGRYWFPTDGSSIGTPLASLMSVSAYTAYLSDIDLPLDRFIREMWSVDFPIGIAYRITDRFTLSSGIVASVPLSYGYQRIDINEIDVSDRNPQIGDSGLTTDDFIQTTSTTNWEANLRMDYLISKRLGVYLGYRHGLSDQHGNITSRSAGSFDDNTIGQVDRRYYALTSETYRPRLVTTGVRYLFN